MASRPRALFVFTELAPRGGAEAVAAWMLQSLRVPYDVTALTWSPPDLEGLNAIYGTSLHREDARWISPGLGTRRAVELVPDPTGSWQKRSWLMRVSKRLHASFDVLVSASSEFDFGRPGVQYVHYPWMAPMFAALERQGRHDGWRIVPALARRAYRPWMAVAGFRFRSMLENLALVNSDWTGEVYRRAYGREARTLYPPVAGISTVPDEDGRKDAFVMVDRLEPDKNHLRVFEILKAVRRKRPDVELHVVGTRLRTSAGEAYYREVRSRIDGESGWIALHENASRAELNRVLSRVRYGIHLRENEHFGMAVAEMARAGLLPFVHDSGGQVEIVEDPRLRFAADEQAVERIGAVLGSSVLREEARAHLRRRSDRFTAERFQDELLGWIEARRDRRERRG